MNSNKLIRFHRIFLPVLFLIVILGACKKDKYQEEIGVCPNIILTSPLQGAINVPLNQTISATFNEKMNPATLVSACFELKDALPVAGILSYNDSSATISFVPTMPLLQNTHYTCTVFTSVRDPKGNAMQKNYVWSFTTVSPLTPTVILTDPANLSGNVRLDKVIGANFNQVMDPLSITGGTFTLKLGLTPVSGVVNYSGTLATFTPGANLISNSTYTATLSAGIKNLIGDSIATDYVWTFQTRDSVGTAPVDLKSVYRFGIIAGVGVSNNAGFSVINNMDVGISPGVRSSVSGFPPAIIVNGAIYASDDLIPLGISALLVQAKQDLTDAYLFAEGATFPAPSIVSGDQGGKTLAPGIFKSNTTLAIVNGNLTLDAQGDPNAIWIFQIASGLTTVGGAGGSIILSGGAQAKNIFWQVGSSAVIGDNTQFKGNLLVLTSITLNSNAVLEGRVLCRNGSVVLTSTNTINKP